MGRMKDNLEIFADYLKIMAKSVLRMNNIITKIREGIG